MAEMIPNEDKFQQLEFQFAEQASEILKTVINMDTTVFYEGLGVVDDESLAKLGTEELVQVNLKFDRLLSGQAAFLLEKTLTAKIVDFMIMGDGEVEFMPDEHLDGILEAINQVVGAEITRLNGLYSVDMHAEVDKADVVPAESLKESFTDWILVRYSVEIEGQGNFKMAKLYHPDIQGQLGKLIAGNADVGAAPAANGGNPPPVEENSAPPKDVKAAQFGEFAKPTGDLGLPPDMDNIVPESLQRVMDLNLPIVIELGRTRMLIKDIIDLSPGSIVELDKLTGEPVDLFVNGKKFAHGEVVVVDENFGVRIIELIRIEERLKSLPESV